MPSWGGRDEKGARKGVMGKYFPPLERERDGKDILNARDKQEGQRSENFGTHWARRREQQINGWVRADMIYFVDTSSSTRGREGM